MINKNDFLKEFNGHANAYSSFMVFGVTLDVLVDELNRIDPDMCVGSGDVRDDGKAIYFEICKYSPELMQNISKDLSCVGFADIGGWYGEGRFVAYENGEDYNDFTAEWEQDNPRRRYEDFAPGVDVPDEDMYFDAFVNVTDNRTGIEFGTGEGAACYDTMISWSCLVEDH